MASYYFPRPTKECTQMVTWVGNVHCAYFHQYAARIRADDFGND
jgi:hypothetical protein